jgi:hypothetical protein
MSSSTTLFMIDDIEYKQTLRVWLMMIKWIAEATDCQRNNLWESSP